MNKITIVMATLFFLMHGQVYACKGYQNVKYLIGDKDNFQPGDQVDLPPQSQLVRKLIDARAPENNDVALDVGGTNRPVGLTYYFCIPQNAQLVNAHIEFRFRGSESVNTDGILYKKPEPEEYQPLMYPVIILQDILDEFPPKQNDPYTVNIDLSNVPVRTSGNHPFPVEPDEYRDLLPELSDGQFDMVFLDDMTIDYSELTLTYTFSRREIPVKITNGKIKTYNWHSDKDWAWFKMNSVEDIRTAVKKAEKNDTPLTFQFGPADEEPIYNFTATSNDFFEVRKNALIFRTPFKDVKVICLFKEEKCAVKIKHSNFDGNALDALLTGDMKVNLGIGNTEYTNTSKWRQYNSINGKWTKYKKK